MKKPTAEEIREIGRDAFIKFGGNEYLIKEYADILFERIEQLESALLKTYQKATERINDLEVSNKK